MEPDCSRQYVAGSCPAMLMSTAPSHMLALVVYPEDIHKNAFIRARGLERLVHGCMTQLLIEESPKASECMQHGKPELFVNALGVFLNLAASGEWDGGCCYTALLALSTLHVVAWARHVSRQGVASVVSTQGGLEPSPHPARASTRRRVSRHDAARP